MKKYIIANWKMNPTTLAEAEDILAYIDEYLKSLPRKNEQSLVICPPFVFLEDVSRMLKASQLAGHAELGSQDIGLADSGAWTGEISGPMLKRLGVQYVIIGHSERRYPLIGGGESDEVVNKKLKTALANELIPIVCIGERERDGKFKEFLKQQVEATFKGLSADQIGKCLIAYEPVWAISSNPGAKADTPESALKSILVIENILIENWKTCPESIEGLKTENLPKVLYGGSVNSVNAKDFLSLDQIAGVLIGGASVIKEEFIKILKQV